MNANTRLLGYLLIGLCFVSGTTNAQDKVPPAPGTALRDPGVNPKSLGLPETVSPMIGFYQGVDQKEKKIKLAFVESVAEVVTKVVKRGGVDTVVEETVYKPTAIAGAVPFADIQFFNTKGEKLTVESVAGKLKAGDTLLISSDERPIGAAYLKVVHPDAIVAVFPLDPFIEPFVVGAAAPHGPPAPAALAPRAPIPAPAVPLFDPFR